MRHCCYIICFLIIGCHNNSNVSGRNDTLSKTINLNLKDSVNGQINSGSEVDSNRIRASIKEMLHNWTAKYNDSLIIDTSISIGNKSIYLLVKNYCLFDSSLTIPENYVSHLGMKKFISNDFASSLLMIVNNRKIVDTVINKSFFLDILLLHDRPELYDFGALLFNGIKFSNDRCKIKYVIEVPLSDVGSGFDADVFYNGKIEAVDDDRSKYRK